jgi:hypothetical protein
MVVLAVVEKMTLNSSFSAVLLDCQRFIEILAKDMQSERGNLLF